MEHYLAVLQREARVVGAAVARGEALELLGLALLEQRTRGLPVHVAPRLVLPDAQVTVVLLAHARDLETAVEPGALEYRSAAQRAGAERFLVGIEVLVLEGLGDVGDLARVGDDLLHELLGLHRAVLNLAQVVLELAGERGRGEPVDVDAPQHVDEPDALHGRTQ